MLLYLHLPSEQKSVSSSCWIARWEIVEGTMGIGQVFGRFNKILGFWNFWMAVYDPKDHYGIDT